MNQLKVGFLFLHPFSESLGSTTRVIEISKSLAKKGVKVTIYDPFEKNQEINGVKVKKINVFGSLDFIFRRLYSLLKRVYYGEKTRKITASKIFQENSIYRSMAKSLSKKMREDQIDLLIIEQDFAIVPGLLASKDNDLPVIVDLHNITAEELVAAGVLDYEDKEFKQMQNDLQKLLHEANGLVVVSEELKKYVEENYKVMNNIVLVPPGGRPRISKVPKRQLPIKLIYAGLLSYREKVDIFVRSIPILRKELTNYKIYMTKKGEELRKIIKENREKSLGIEFFWFEKRDELFELMKQCHVGILTSSRNKARILGPPIKLLDYLSVGLPVVANYIGGWSDIIEKEKIGIATSDEPREFAKGIIDLVGDEETYYRYANNALRLIKEKYNWSEVTKPLSELIRKVA